MAMPRWFAPLTVVVAAMFAYAPISIANAPIESTMLLVQKIFYFHVPSWFVMFSGAFLCAGASVRYLTEGHAKPTITPSPAPSWQWCSD